MQPMPYQILKDIDDEFLANGGKKLISKKAEQKLFRYCIYIFDAIIGELPLTSAMKSFILLIFAHFGIKMRDTEDINEFVEFIRKSLLECINDAKK